MITSLREKYLAQIKQVYYAQTGNGAELARLSGVAASSICCIVQGKRKHSLEMLMKLAAAARRMKARGQ